MFSQIPIKIPHNKELGDNVDEMFFLNYEPKK